jgi:hypothetical protein
MGDDPEDLRRRMEAAVAAMDFEEAGRLRDRLKLLDSAAPMEAGASRLRPQIPGAMGLGTSDQVFTPPPGWKPPPKPDLMTSGRKKPRGRR